MIGFASRLSLWSVTSIAVALLGGVACSSSSSRGSGTGGTTGSGGSTTGGNGGSSTGTGGAGGGTATGGSGGIAAGGAGTGATMCLPATNAVLLDFTNAGAAGASGTDAAFGDYTTVFSGGTFYYPAPNATPTPTYPLTSDTTGGNWHLTGTVGDYSGFGIYFGNCQEVDFSAYSGFQFTIGGTAPSGSAPGTVTFGMGTAPDTIAYQWFVTKSQTDGTALTATPNFGTCFPASATNQYDGTCGDPSHAVTLSATPTVVTVHWADLVGGKPNASVDPAQITSVWWSFPWTGASDTPYPVDITVDNIQLVP